MKNDLVERCARGIFEAWSLYRGTDGTWDEAVRGHSYGPDEYPAMYETVELARREANAALAIARPAILEEAAKAYETHDKADRGWINGSLWDALNREASARVRALAHTTGQEGGR